MKTIGGLIYQCGMRTCIQKNSNSPFNSFHLVFLWPPFCIYAIISNFNIIVPYKGYNSEQI
jgi:hypothetical protein